MDALRLSRANDGGVKALLIAVGSYCQVSKEAPAFYGSSWLQVLATECMFQFVFSTLNSQLFNMR